MQKIGLVSYQFWYNYGTCLQAYALWKKIQMMGFESEYINFGWHYPYHEVKVTLVSRISRFIKGILGFDKVERHLADNNSINNRLFEEFRKLYIHESLPIDIENLSTTENQYSKYIVGSDQTWNPDCVEEKFFKIFLLSFVHEPEKKCAYAPSIGRNHVDDHCLEMYKQYLSEFNYISCRETSGCQILTKALDRNVLQVIDPTLLLNAKDWSEIARNPINENGYILCYILGSKTCICEFAKKLAKKENKKLYIISKNYIIFQKYHKYILCGVGPSEFVGLIKNCSCMVTDSFHGTIFSINFKKDFYTFHKRPGTSNVSDNSRILDTLKQFGLEGRFREDADYSFDRHIEYDKISLFLDKLRKESVSYLENVLKA